MKEQTQIDAFIDNCIDAGMTVEKQITIYTGTYERAMLVRNKLSAFTSAKTLTISSFGSEDYRVRYTTTISE